MRRQDEGGPSCGAWNTLVESKVVTGGPTSARLQTKAATANIGKKSAVRLDEIDTGSETRIMTGMKELDRVLGGGAVAGSLVLVGGEPGIGKSTLLLQICKDLCKNRKVLYVSGEESQRQLKLRADRIKLQTDNLFILSETNLNDILAAVSLDPPDILIIDSIQTTYSPELTAAPGSVSQIKECTLALMGLAKSEGITTFLVGHINKEGALAGPKVLEHMVDCVLYFEGDRDYAYRILRADKNRFGSTNEIGVFEMQSEGRRFQFEMHRIQSKGVATGGFETDTCGIQALLTYFYAAPRRVATAWTTTELCSFWQYLKTCWSYRFQLYTYINVVGGLRLTEPAADHLLPFPSHLPTDKPIGDRVAALEGGACW